MNSSGARMLTDAHAHAANAYARTTLVDCGSLPVPLRTEGVAYSVGIHPCSIADGWERTVDGIERAVSAGEVVAIGECGFDRTSPAAMEQQTRVFARLAEISYAARRPMVVHCVRAADALLRFAGRMPSEGAWMVHGFRGRPELMRQLLDKGFSISFGLRANERSVAACPADRIFLETDTAPASALPEIYARWSEVRGEDLAPIVAANFARTFIAGE